MNVDCFEVFDNFLVFLYEQIDALNYLWSILIKNKVTFFHTNSHICLGEYHSELKNVKLNILLDWFGVDASSHQKLFQIFYFGYFV